MNYQLGEGVGLYLKFKKDEIHGSDESVETWKAKIEDVYLRDFNGEKQYRFSPKTLSILNTCEIEENTEVDEEYISQSFVVRPDTGNMAHRAMEKLLKMADADTNIHWRSLLVDESPLHSIADFQSALDEALKQKFVKYILIQHPRQYPAFIRDDDKAQGVD